MRPVRGIFRAASQGYIPGVGFPGEGLCSAPAHPARRPCRPYSCPELSGPVPVPGLSGKAPRLPAGAAFSQPDLWPGPDPGLPVSLPVPLPSGLADSCGLAVSCVLAVLSGPRAFWPRAAAPLPGSTVLFAASGGRAHLRQTPACRRSMVPRAASRYAPCRSGTPAPACASCASPVRLLLSPPLHLSGAPGRRLPGTPVRRARPCVRPASVRQSRPAPKPADLVPGFGLKQACRCLGRLPRGGLRSLACAPGPLARAFKPRAFAAGPLDPDLHCRAFAAWPSSHRPCPWPFLKDLFPGTLLGRPFFRPALPELI